MMERSSNLQLPLDTTPETPAIDSDSLPAPGQTAPEPAIDPESISAPAPPVDERAPDASTPDARLKIARWISRILHPFLVSPLSIVLILWLAQGDWLSALSWAGLCAAFVVVPATFYLRDKLRRKLYTDADVSVREHRYGFYIFGGVCMLLCFAVLLWLEAPPVLIAGFVTALVALGAAIIINRLWVKISIHTGAMAGVAAAALFFSLPLAGFLLLGTILVSWARLALERHTLTEALLGGAVAMTCVALVFGTLLGVGPY